MQQIAQNVVYMRTLCKPYAYVTQPLTQDDTVQGR